ncbi:MAG TPA: 2-oxoglutarate dehydrogenase E1 component [Sphingomicrobium sp.]|nr:2-oxoglutarate dehydrogenase E1 component [Sphingomicrobium sp.]
MAAPLVEKVEARVVIPAVSAEYIIDLYHRYLRDPASVDAGWQPYFDELWGKHTVPPTARNVALEVAAARLTEAYRQRGHFAAQLDPLGLWRPPLPPELEPTTYGIDAAALDEPIQAPALLGSAPTSVRGLLAALRGIYSGSIGFDCAHVDESEARAWLYAAAEQGAGQPNPAQRRVAAERIIEATEFEQFLNRRFPGKKRFGAEGAEALIAWIDAVLARSAAHGVRDVVIGGTARGRLNTMANIVNKPLTQLLYEFAGRRAFPDDVRAASDVPYHFGYVGERTFGDATLRVTYCHNPSHLEAIDGVALGRVRARQDAFSTKEEGRRQVLGLEVHTDAAFAGQGVAGEVLQLSQVPAYATGGTIHLVINNQVGFTTDPSNGRSSIYCTDVARTIGAPILHVNGDDVDAVVRTALIAADYRARFHADVIIDLVCYRRWGHNELDEPMFTQPRMYRKIAEHPPVRERYVARTVAEGVLSQADADEHAKRCFEALDAAYKALEGAKPNRVETLDVGWPTASFDAHKSGTGVPLETLRRIGLALSEAPDGVNVNSKIVRQFKERREAVTAGEGITWAFGEALALATIACEGINVRFSGQDTPRGAFSQRHFVLTDQDNGVQVEPFNLLQPKQGRCAIIGSPLSEYSVLGFEYGYAMDARDSLVVWEAQFGDFANVAQVVIDQFISSGEDKWLDQAGLVLMLPHGLEGQGPDHSSGRIERFLQMCANNNMTLANCSTPANLFHLLRRQARARPPRPLVVFTTKSLLRHRLAVSRLDEFGPNSSFQPVIGAGAAPGVRRLVLCSGKIYYDLLARISESRMKGVGLIRLEQLYPFPAEALRAEISRFPGAAVLWCQEEPLNMGAWSYLDRQIEALLQETGNSCAWPHVISRPASASTAIGTSDEHSADQATLVARAVGLAEVSQRTAT